MKQMLLTGLATDQKFGAPTPQYFLVFNEGELRVPISEEAAETVVKAMYSGNGVSVEQPPAEDEDVMHTDPDGYNNESDIPQA